MVKSSSSLISLNTQAFFLFGGLLALILFFFPFQEDRLIFRRIQTDWRQLERKVQSNIRTSCRTLKAEAPGALAHLMVKRLSLFVGDTPTSSCELSVQSHAFSRFSLLTRMRLFVKVTRVDSRTVLFEQPFSLQFPHPLCFLPVLLFFVCLLLGKSLWGLGMSFSLYTLMLYNFNLIETVRRTISHAELVISTDKTWLGFTLLSFFLVLNRQEFLLRPVRRLALSPPETSLNRTLLGTIGLWNPAFFTYLLTSFFQRGSIKRLSRFFDSQILIAVLSLYLFSVKDRFTFEAIRNTITNPRYFSFALCLGLLVTYGVGHRKTRSIPVWLLPGFKMHLGFVFVVEVIAHLWKPMLVFPTLTRVSFALLLSQLMRSKSFGWQRFIKDCSQPVAWIFLSALVTMMSVEMGVVDLALVIFEPKAHPSVLTLFTYLSGIFLGVLTGSFSTAFFSLIPELLHNQSDPIVRAALLDGILAGSLLSPYSLFTLLPVAVLQVSLNEVLLLRMKRLVLPLLVGAIIYALSAVNSVSILRPVTFIFLCLAIIVFRLHRNGWKMSKIWPWELRLHNSLNGKQLN